MALEAVSYLERLGQTPAGGLLVVPEPTPSPHPDLPVLVGDHPIPGAGSFAASEGIARAIKGVRAGGVRLGLWSDPWSRTGELTRSLVGDLEDSYFRLIRTNLQLLSLKEVGRSVIASLDRERTVQSVLEYLHRGIGFTEFGLFTWRPEEGVFVPTKSDGPGDCDGETDSALPKLANPSSGRASPIEAASRTHLLLTIRTSIMTCASPRLRRAAHL